MAYQQQAEQLALALVQREITVVYGGGHVGLMGVVADATLAAGGKVIGVIPTDIADKEVQHTGLTELHIVDSMHERKMMMTRLADGMVALPGGLGTIEELFEVLTWSQLGFHAKPVGLLNVEGYFDPLLEFLDKMVQERFVKPVHRNLLLTDTDVEGLLQKMEAFVPSGGDKWFGQGKP